MFIRKAEEKDIQQINALLYQVQNIHFEGRPDIFRQGAKKYNDEELKVLLHDKQRPVFVAVDENDTVFGYAFCIYEQTVISSNLQNRKTLFIDDLCVDKTARGRHIGTELYNYVVKTAKEHGCYHITLNVWRLNEAAIAFYEKCGFSPLKIVMEQIL